MNNDDIYTNDIKKQFYVLESLRGIAAIYVVFGHARFIFFYGGSQYIKDYPISEQSIFDIGLFVFNMSFSFAISAVILFFIISGFSIDYSIQKQKIKQKNNFYLLVKIFFARRVIRIYIPYIISIVISILLLLLAIMINQDLLLFKDDSEIYNIIYKAYMHSLDVGFILDSLFYNLVGLISDIGFINQGIYIGANQPFWSLNLEVIFYIFAPLIILFLNIYILTFILILCLFIGIFDLQILFINVYIMSFLKYLPFFIFGVLLRRNITKIVNFSNQNNISPLLYLIIFIVVFSVAFYLDYINFSYISKVIVSLGFIFLIIFMFSNSKISLMITEIFNKFGERSYTIYLLHFPILIFFLAIYEKFMNNYKIDNLFLFFIFGILAIFVANLAYYLVEKQTQDYLKRSR